MTAELDQTLDTEVQFQYGLTLCHLEMFQEAIKQLNYVLSINPNHVDALYNLGQATHMETEDADEAIQYFDKAIQIDPKHLLSQHAKQTFKSLKMRRNNMSNPTLFDYSMVKGTVDTILFQNKDNFYTVLKVDSIETNELFDNLPTVVGFFPILLKEMSIRLKDKLFNILVMVNNLKLKHLKKNCLKLKMP